MSNFDWRVSVRVTGVRDGWQATLVDTPVFELRSDAQYGGIYTRDDAAYAARGMFAQLAQDNDEIAVTVCALDGSDYRRYVGLAADPGFRTVTA